jgi:MFS family permease
MAITGAVSMGMGTLNYGLFIKPMGDELGIGRSIFGWAQTSRQVTNAMTSPLMGRLIDRFGSRVLLALGAVTTAAVLLGLAFISQPWQLVALFALMGTVGIASPVALATTVPVGKWFVRNRGTAYSYVSMGIPIGGVIFLPLSQLFLDGYGWRVTWMILAAIGISIIVPLSLLLVRREPEDMGLLPDGAPTPIDPADVNAVDAADRPLPPSSDERSWTRAEALRSPTFWRLTFAFSVVMLAISTVVVHRIPNFMDRGLDPGLVAIATAADTLAAGVSTMVLGLLVRRIRTRLLGAVSFAVLSLATFLIIMAHSTLLMFIAMVTFGLGGGGLLLMNNYVWAEYFGRRHLGSIRGAVMPITLIFGGAGAPLAGHIYDFTGSYNAAWGAGIVLFLLGGIVLATTPAPSERAGSPGQPPTTA